MANVVDLQAKYASISAANPWLSIPGTRFLLDQLVDIDGDGCAEVIASSPALLGLPNAQAGILSYFDYTAISDTYSTPQPPQLLVTSNMTLNGTDIIVPATIRQQGSVDLLVFNATLTILTLYSVTSGILAQVWQAAEIIAGSIAWVLGAGNAFFACDIDGDGLDEIFILANQTPQSSSMPTALAVLKWQADDTLAVIWQAPDNAIPGGGGSQWNVYSSDLFFVGDFAGDGNTELLISDGDAWIGLVQWDTSQNGLQAYWMTADLVYSATSSVPNWTLAAGTSFAVGDIDGDGATEVVAFDGSQLGAFKWDGSDLRVIGVSVGTVAAGEAASTWSLTAFDRLSVGLVQSASFSSLFFFSWSGNPLAPSTAIGVVRWDTSSKQFVLDFVATDSVAGPDQSWTIAADNLFCLGDVNGDGVDEICVQSDSASALAYLAWSAGSSDLVPAWMCSTAGSGSGPLQGWGMGIISQAPATAFSWPSDTAVAIYNQTCQSLTASVGTTNDLRSLYYNSNLANALSTYAGELATAKSDLQTDPVQYYWPWMSKYEVDDLTGVIEVLEEEFISVPAIWAFDSNLDDFLYSLYNQQLTDLTTVQNNITYQPASTTTTNYWAGQIFEAAIWAVAAMPLGPVAQMTLAAGASFYGSVISSVNGNSTQAYFSDIGTQLKSNYVTAKNALDAMVSTNGGEPSASGIVTDPIKIKACGNFAAIVGAWNSQKNDVVAGYSSNYNRIIFYGQLMRQIFQVNSYASIVDPSLNWLNPNLGSLPSNASQCTTGPTSSTVLVIMQPELGQFNTPLFPPDVLIDDLQSLGFGLSSIIDGQAPLNLPVVASGDNFGHQQCYLYTTNQTSYQVWITIRSSVLKTIFASGYVQPGQTAIWNQQVWWNVNYTVEGEVQDSGGNDICPPTEVEVQPSGPTNGFQGYAVAIEYQNGGAWFNHLN